MKNNNNSFPTHFTFHLILMFTQIPIAVTQIGLFLASWEKVNVEYHVKYHFFLAFRIFFFILLLNSFVFLSPQLYCKPLWDLSLVMLLVFNTVLQVVCFNIDVDSGARGHMVRQRNVISWFDGRKRECTHAEQALVCSRVAEGIKRELGFYFLYFSIIYFFLF